MFDPDETIYAYLTGRLTTWETSELIHWINESPENKLKFQTIREYWENSSNEIVLDKACIDSAYDKLSIDLFDTDSDDIGVKKIAFGGNKNQTRMWWLSAAASITLALGVFVFYNFSDTSETKTITLQTITKENPKGRKSRISLPDGTKVWLNAESKVEYKETFGVSDRDISLTGEAYFDVEKSENLPFKVETSGVAVTALGTEFNVRSYEDESSIQVLLEEGKVMIRNETNEEYLIEGESMIYSKREEKFVKLTSDFEDLLGWRNGILLFKDASQNDVLKILERWYGIKIQVLNGGAISEWKYTSKFENESLENVLNSMSHVKQFDFEIKEDSVQIRYKN